MRVPEKDQKILRASGKEICAGVDGEKKKNGVK